MMFSDLKNEMTQEPNKVVHSTWKTESPLSSTTTLLYEIFDSTAKYSFESDLLNESADPDKSESYSTL